jgi:ABC-2 type transport system ATP-binding protein
MIIETHALSKDYGTTRAVRDLDLRVPSGGISAFLGPNGHGKTSTIKMLLGLTHPTAGRGEVLGHSITETKASVAIRRRTAYVSEDKQVYGFMTVRQVIAFTRGFYPKWRPDREQELLKAFELPGERLVKSLSKGMRTKLALLLALSRGADLLILDEPSEGLDPVSTEIMLQQVVLAASDGATVFFSSHQLSEAERIADRIFLIVRGRLALHGGLEEIRQRYRRVNAIFLGKPPVEQWRDGCVESISCQGNSCSLLVRDETDRVVAHLHSLAAVNIEVHLVDLRELFLASAMRTEN